MSGRVVVLASGGGRSLDNLQQHIDDGRLAAELVGLVVSRQPLGVIERAERLGIPWQEIGRSTHPQVADRDRALVGVIDAMNPDLIVMAGWLALLPIPAKWSGKVINIHPALLPAYGGKGYWGHHVHEAVCADAPEISGCSVHFASLEYDQGALIVQEAVPFAAEDDAESLGARVFAAEKRVLPEAIAHVLSGRVSLVEGQTEWNIG